MSIVPAANLLRTAVPQASSEEPEPDGAPENPPTESWQRQLAAAIRDPAELRKRLSLPAIEAELAGSEGFSTLVPESFLRRMQPANPHDPLLLQVLPGPAESDVVPGFVTDPVGDTSARKAAGMLQKYAGRALLIATGACAVHCRYCFRREYPYQNEPRRLNDWQPAIDCLAEDSSITEVILSGGDPLMLTDIRLTELCQKLDAIPHIERIRFHTRLPIVLPSRVTAEFLQMLKGLRAQPLMIVHANHGNEIADDCQQALQRIVQAGVPVLNQAVLLRNINDNADALELLCRRLTNIGVMPYYLHQLDRVMGAAHFEVDIAVGRRLIDELAVRLPGYAIPKFVQEIPGQPNKTSLF